MIKKVLISLAVIGVVLVGCNTVKIDTTKLVVAEVGSTQIIRSDLDSMFIPTQKELEAKYPNITVEEKKQVMITEKTKLLNNMVDNIVLYNKAIELKIFNNDADIDTEVSNRLKSLKEYYKTDEAFNKSLADKGMTTDILQKTLRQQVIYDKVYQYMVKDITVTDEQISQYYKDNPQVFTDQPNTMDVYHILLNTESEAKDIKSKLDAGGDFAALAKQYSIDKETKDVGGYMGQLATDNINYDKTFVSAVIKLNNNTISDPFKDSYGYEIVKVMNKTNIQPLPFDSVKDKIKSMILYERKTKVYNDTLKTWKQGIKITLYTDNMIK